jgi:methyl-accepting chemotaxis protein
MTTKRSFFRSLAGKVFGTAMIPVVLFLLLIAFYMLPKVHGRLVESKKEGVRHLVEAVQTEVTHLAQAAKDGRMSREEAQARAKDLVDAIRFAEANYVFIFGPGNVTLVNANIRQFVDKPADQEPPKLVAIYEGLRAASGATGGGFYDYQFTKQGREGLFPKSAYAKRIDDWDWVIGAGVYLDDIDAEMFKITVAVLGVALAVAVLVAYISRLRSNTMVRPLRQLVDGLRDSDLSRHIDVATRDEIGEAAEAFNVYNGKMLETVRNIASLADRVGTCQQH